MIRQSRWYARTCTAIAAATVLSLSACGGGTNGSTSAAGDGASGLHTVRVVVLNGTQAFPVQVLQDQGIAEKHGLKLEVTKTAGPAGAYTQMQSSEFQIGFGGWTSIAQLRASGTDLTNVYSQSGYASSDMLVKKDSPIKSFKDLAGKRVGVFGSPSSSFARMFALESKKFFGVDTKTQLHIVYGATGLLGSQLENDSLDAALLLDPVATQYLATDDYRSVGNLGKIWEQKTGQKALAVCVTVNGSWAKQNKQTLSAFIDAFKEAQDYLASNEEVWQGLAEEVNVDSEAEALLRQRVVNNNISRWGQDYIDQQKSFLDEVNTSLGQVKGFPSQVPDGTFSTAYVH